MRNSHVLHSVHLIDAMLKTNLNVIKTQVQFMSPALCSFSAIVSCYSFVELPSDRSSNRSLSVTARSVTCFN